MNIMMTGASGLLGAALRDALDERGDTVVPVMRGEVNLAEIPHWNPGKGELFIPEDLQIDAVIHLSGASLSRLPWTKKYKNEIVMSRVQSTLLLSAMLAAREQKPRVFISASAIGIYGDRGEEELNESSEPGTGFLADTCSQWEASTQLAEKAGMRVVHARTGLVLSKTAGLLKTMLLPFRWGLGAVLGSGKQYMSWISLKDTVEAILYAMDTATLSGAVNIVGPNPVTNKEFSKTLGRIIQRPVLLKAPAWGLRLLLGVAAREMILVGARVIPSKLINSGFKFHHESLEKALETTLEKPDDSLA